MRGVPEDVVVEIGEGEKGGWSDGPQILQGLPVVPVLVEQTRPLKEQRRVLRRLLELVVNRRQPFMHGATSEHAFRA